MSVNITYADVEARWHLLSDNERVQADALIADAVQLLTDLKVDVNTISEKTLVRTVCAMVKKAMLANDCAGISQQSQSALGFSENYTYTNPSGDLYLTAFEKKALGISSQKAFNMQWGDV